MPMPVCGPALAALSPDRIEDKKNDATVRMVPGN